MLANKMFERSSLTWRIHKQQSSKHPSTSSMKSAFNQGAATEDRHGTSPCPCPFTVQDGGIASVDTFRSQCASPTFQTKNKVLVPQIPREKGNSSDVTVFREKRIQEAPRYCYELQSNSSAERQNQGQSPESCPRQNSHSNLSNFFALFWVKDSLKSGWYRGSRDANQFQLLIHHLLRAMGSSFVSDSAGISVLAVERASISMFLVTARSFPLCIRSLDRSLHFFNFSTALRSRLSVSLFSVVFYASPSTVLSPSW